ncbi:MAG: NUDIX domain-containing protein [Alphaproteobacteria bacterium]|nr:NUDIX domain-containing protein [Alphaproteobacteria bacterium]
MIPSEVEEIERKVGYQGVFRVLCLQMRHRRFDGGWTKVLTREVFDRGKAVAVVPYDPERDEVVLIEQFRCGAYVAGWSSWMLEIVAGIIDEGEQAEDVARREMQEETGMVLTALEPIARFMPSPGAVSETVDMYVGRVDAAAADAYAGLATEGEDIRVCRMAAQDAIDLLPTGRIDTAITLVGLQWLALHRADLRARWRQG